MSDPGYPRLEPDLATLLEAERSAMVPPAALDRVRVRMDASIAGASGNSASAGPRARGLAAAAIRSGKAVFVMGLLSGLPLGAALHAMFRGSPPFRTVSVERPSPGSATGASDATGRQGAQAVATDGEPKASDRISTDRTDSVGARPPPRPARAVSQDPPSSLLAERSLLDEARRALARDDAATALDVTDRHARQFTHPQLAEEREAIAIQALVVGGRYGEARRRAAHFEAVAPNSLFLSAVHTSLASIP
jgi:hypothetical protein